MKIISVLRRWLLPIVVDLDGGIGSQEEEQRPGGGIGSFVKATCYLLNTNPLQHCSLGVLSVLVFVYLYLYFWRQATRYSRPTRCCSLPIFSCQICNYLVLVFAILIWNDSEGLETKQNNDAIISKIYKTLFMILNCELAASAIGAQINIIW